MKKLFFCLLVSLFTTDKISGQSDSSLIAERYLSAFAYIDSSTRPSLITLKRSCQSFTTYVDQNGNSITDSLRADSIFFQNEFKGGLFVSDESFYTSSFRGFAFEFLKPLFQTDSNNLNYLLSNEYLKLEAELSSTLSNAWNINHGDHNRDFSLSFLSDCDSCKSGLELNFSKIGGNILLGEVKATCRRGDQLSQTLWGTEYLFLFDVQSSKIKYAITSELYH